MFSFHKPKVYRSSTGCCICKAKSSSSRFTDSKKYELDFIECFQLTTPRKGEICNACVLLVKRFKRLPAGSNRHWGHVVDARVGPGLKSMTKFKKRKEEQKEPSSTPTTTSNKNGNNTSNGNSNNLKTSLSVPERFCKIFKKTKKKPSDNIMKKKQQHQDHDVDNSGSSDAESSPASPMSSISDAESSNGAHDRENIKPRRKFVRKSYHPIKHRKILYQSNLIDTEFWQEKTTCCGVIFEYPVYDAIIIDLGSYNPCKEHLLTKKLKIKENGVGDLEQELNGNCNTDDLLIKLTDEQIQENIENASLSGFNKISKVSDLFNTNTTALKKHHLYSKRQNATQPCNVEEKKVNTIEKTDAKYPLQTNVIVQPTPRISSEDIMEISGKPNGKDNLHKIKPDGKISKNPLDKLSALKLKPLDFNVKNLVKLCTEKGLKPKLNGTEGLIKGVTGKFMSDNSSDSGYEESHEAQNLMQKPKTQNVNSIARPIVLANGIKLHVPPQLLGLPHSTIINPLTSSGTPTAPIICLPSSTVTSTTSVPQDLLLLTQQSESESNSGTNVISVGTSNNSSTSQDPLSTSQVIQQQAASTN